MKLSSLLALVTVFVLTGVVSAGSLGTAFTYQGQLTDAGEPVNGSYDLQFTLFDALSEGAPVGSSFSTNAVAVSNGLFAVTLDFGAAFDGQARWLAIGVKTNRAAAYTALTPRQPLTPTPYALYAPSAGTATVAGSAAPGSIGNAALAPNVVTGDKIADGTISDADIKDSGIKADKVVGGDLQARRLKVGQNHTLSGDLATIAGGNANAAGGYRAAVGGGETNVASGHAAVVAGGDFNTATGPRSTVSGGFSNRATEYGATVSGGDHNQATGDRATVDGGLENIASGGSATVGGGRSNLARGEESAVGGGGANIASAPRSTVSGGYGNVAADYAATIGGGDFHRVEAFRGTIGGGQANTIRTNATHATIAGGVRNVIQDNAYMSAIGGGTENVIQTNAWLATIAGGDASVIESSAGHATIGGGYRNLIRTEAYGATIAGGGDHRIQSNAHNAAIGGGAGNVIQTNSYLATIAGGYSNSIQPEAPFAAVGGGLANTNSGPYATIPGGHLNVAAGWYSFAAGQRAHADHSGSFVWADGTAGDFFSTTNNEFGVRAHGGVRLETGGAGLVLDGHPVLSGQIQSSQLAGGSVASGTIADGSILPNDLNLASFAGTFWKLEGNSGTIPGTQFVGTTDNQPLEVRVNGQRVMRFQPGASLVGGAPGNYIDPNVRLSVICGGGEGGNGTNSILSSCSTIGGGWHNEIGSYAPDSTIGGGVDNAIQSHASYATVSGGGRNTIQTEAGASTIGGGYENSIQTSAADATIGGGSANKILAYADYATIPGGQNNEVGGTWGFAAGYRAKALHKGCFVWADSQNADFTSTAEDQFLIRARRGVGIGGAAVAPYRLYVVGDAYSTGGWSGSDARWKKNVQPITDALAKIRQLQGVTYEWRRGDFPEREFDEGTQLGFLAQDLEAVLPESVRTDSNGYKAIAYEKLTALLVEGVKEQETEVKALQARNLRLEQEVAELKTMVESLLQR